MPYKQRTQCRHPDCPVLIPVGSKYCDAHRRQHPLCVRCGRPAQVVDHIVPHRGREQLFWDESNWQALCKACHDRKTGEEDSRPTYEY